MKSLNNPDPVFTDGNNISHILRHYSQEASERFWENDNFSAIEITCSIKNETDIKELVESLNIFNIETVIHWHYGRVSGGFVLYAEAGGPLLAKLKKEMEDDRLND